MSVLFPAAQAVRKFMEEQFAPLPMCVDSTMQLVDALAKIWPNHDAGTHVITEVEVQELRAACMSFDTALSIQLDHIDTYRVMPKGVFDTRLLIENPGLCFEQTWDKLFPLAKTDWISASKCLAFDLPTACGFHAIRALEAQSVEFLKLMLQRLRAQEGLRALCPNFLRGNEVKKESTDLIDYLRSNHRNPLMHPEDTLDVPEALAIFDLTKSAIIYLIKEAQARGL